MHKSFTRQALITITAAIIFCSGFKIINSNYVIGDGYWTPLRALYKSTENISSFDKIYQFINLTTHNDSVKLFPTLVEWFFFHIQSFWEPRVSLAIGFISWLLCYLLFVKYSAINRELPVSSQCLH